MDQEWVSRISDTTAQEAYRRPQDVRNGQVMVSKLVLRTSPGRWLLRTSVGPKMVALSSKKVF